MLVCRRVFKHTLSFITSASFYFCVVNCRLPTIQQEVQQRKLLYMGLYLLIWGEAANLRFMPECLCYIYHHVCFKMFLSLLDRYSLLYLRLYSFYSGFILLLLNHPTHNQLHVIINQCGRINPWIQWITTKQIIVDTNKGVE